MEKIPKIGEQKIQEYINRIKAGESKDSILQGLPPSFVTGIEAGLNESKKSNESSTEQIKTTELDEKIFIPPQYEGLDAETLDFIWTIPIYVDPERTRKENERKQKVLNIVRKQEEVKKKFVNEEQNQKKIDNLRDQLGLPKSEVKQENLTQEDYETFRVKNGETDIGVYWYEYGNVAAKKKKESGKFEWGKERIYFDVPLSDMIKLRDLCLSVAKQYQIPIAFKHLDVEKTHQIDLREDSSTSRFVANFASLEDAKKFYEALSQQDDYKKMKSDRNLDYHGYKIDDVAHYASGYREQREPLKRIVEQAILNPDGNYSFPSADGTKMTKITKEQYDYFVKKFNDMPDPAVDWNKA